MENTNFKKFIVACVATFTFIGFLNNKVEASAEDQVINENQQTDASTREIDIDKLVKEPVQPAITISEKEQDLFSRLVEAEAKGEPYEGKLAVATVVLNRVDSPDFPNSITEVIYEVVGKSYAFSPVQNGEINKPASDEAKQAVQEALTRKDRVTDSIYFYNPEIATDEWIRSRPVDTTIGNHTFAK